MKRSCRLTKAATSISCGGNFPSLRERALLLAARGATIRAIGDALKISPSCVSKWKKLQRETGSLKHGKIGGHKTSVLSGATAEWLRERVHSSPFTLRKLPAELAARRIKTNMAPLRSWGPRGQRLEARVPHGTLTFIAALRHDRIDAPWVIDGPINGDIFTVYIQQVLVPTLAKGDLVTPQECSNYLANAGYASV